MALPRKLKRLNVFLNGDNWVGEAEDFTPAKLTRKFEAYRGGGMGVPSTSTWGWMTAPSMFRSPSGLRRTPAELHG